MATKTVALSDGREVTFDSAKIRLRDARALAGTIDEKLGTIARLSGLTDEQLDDLSLDDFIVLGRALDEATTIPKAT